MTAETGQHPGASSKRAMLPGADPGRDAALSAADAGFPASPAGRRIVAIDGPAGAGKSSVAARIAAQFRLLNLETGAMYRAFALKAIRAGMDLDDAAALEALSGATAIALEPAEGGNRVLLDQVDVTGELRSPEITQAASRISVHAAVRSWMVDLQREMGARGHVVMEGRDIGTAVFPDADVKVFLDASPEARSQRRYQQGAPTPQDSVPDPGPAAPADPAAVLADMRERDQRDRNRAQSPLRAADDAVVIDSTGLTLDEVVKRVADLITVRWAAAPHPSRAGAGPTAEQAERAE